MTLSFSLHKLVLSSVAWSRYYSIDQSTLLIEDNHILVTLPSTNKTINPRSLYLSVFSFVCEFGSRSVWLEHHSSQEESRAGRLSWIE